MATGQLRVYFGAAPGVGKTFKMLEEGHRRLERGTDVVVGFVETHGRAHTADVVSLGQALGLVLAPTGAMVVSAVTVLGTIVPSAPGYVGTFELAASAAAGWFGVPAESALAFAIVVHGLTVFVLAIGGALSLVWLGTALGDLTRATSEESSPAPAPQTARRPADARLP